MPYPAGPPGMWIANAHQAQIERLAPLHARLMADPAYQHAGFPTSPDDLDLQHPDTANLLRQQTAETDQDANYNQQLARVLQGLRAAWHP